MDRELSHEALQALTGAYALDAVAPDERDQMELHLMECPRCRAEVAEYREVAAFLAHNGHPAPEGLWDRISGALEETPPPLDLAPVVPLPARRATGARIAAAVAAVAAVAAAFFGVKVVDLDNELERIESQNALERLVVQVQQDPRSRTVDLVSANGTQAAEVVLRPDGTGFLVKDRLAPLPPDRTYQLWALVDGKAISAGVLGPDPGIAPFTAATDPAGFAISNEARGGAAQPTEALYTGELS
jgi:anti-sigma-K factor RskA/putative zinc finger protein